MPVCLFVLACLGPSSVGMASAGAKSSSVQGRPRFSFGISISCNETSITVSIATCEIYDYFWLSDETYFVLQIM